MNLRFLESESVGARVKLAWNQANYGGAD